MADTPTVRFESKMMIDGELVDGAAGTFTNINPATEEVLGAVANASILWGFRCSLYREKV